MTTRINPIKIGLTIAGLAFFSLPIHAEILITEYVEGSSNNKAIELYNSGTESVALSGYELVRYKDGDTTPSSHLNLETQQIGSNDFLVLLNTNFNLDKKAEITAPIFESGSIQFNGSDAVALLKNGMIVDVIGNIPTESEWGKDITYRRNTESLVARTQYQAEDWVAFEKDDTRDLGKLGIIEVPDPLNCEGVNFTPIHTIQGNGAKSPFVIDGFESSDEFYVQGVVTAISSLDNGFYIQSLAPDNDPQTSEGILVYSNAANIKAGDVVCVNAPVKEYFDLTELAPSSNQVAVLSQASIPDPIHVEILDSDDNFQATLERYEGMLVTLPEALDMRITRTFSYDYDARRNNLVLSQGQINHQPNEQAVAGSEEAKQASKNNADRRLFVESNQKAADGEVPYYPTWSEDLNQDSTADNYLRINDRIHGLTGVITYSYGEFRLIVTQNISQENVTHLSDRSNTPVIESGDLRIATFNVLNYFNSPYDGDSNSFGENRGAESHDEFLLQQEKIANAMVQLNADIVGIMEVENNGFGEQGAINSLARAINEKIVDANLHYQVVTLDTNQDGAINAQDTVGTDAISVGVLYRPSKVTVDSSRIITLPMQDVNGDKAYQRDSITPTFLVNSKLSGGETKRLTISVNHFKSKGSTCWEDDNLQKGEDLDLQGSCENFRVAAAVAVGEAMENLPGDKIILGDLNSYSMEDPMLVLTNYRQETHGKVIKAARNTQFVTNNTITPQFGDDGAIIERNYGYTDVVRQFRSNTWGYSYNDEVGDLDHILVSPDLLKHVVDATNWNINSSETPIYSYAKSFKGSLPNFDDVYRSSDHDPAVVEIRYSQQDPEQPVINGDKFTLRYTLPPSAVVGDTLTIRLSRNTMMTALASTTNLSESVTVSEAHLNAGHIDLDFTHVEAGDYTATKTLTDVNGTIKHQEQQQLTVQANDADNDPTPDTDNPVDNQSNGDSGGGATSPLWLMLMFGLAGMRLRRRNITFQSFQSFQYKQYKQ